MRRTLWLTLGLGLGMGLAVMAARRFGRLTQSLSPEGVQRGLRHALDNAGQLVQEIKQASEERQAELRKTLLSSEVEQ